MENSDGVNLSDDLMEVRREALKGGLIVVLLGNTMMLLERSHGEFVF